VSVGILWLFFSTACVGIFPLWQGRKTMAHTVKSMYLDITGKRKPTLQGRMQQVEGRDGAETPNEKVEEVYSKKE
jgi:urea-proton symporter